MHIIQYQCILLMNSAAHCTSIMHTPLSTIAIPWAGGQGWEIEDTLVYLRTLQQDGGQHNHEIFVDIPTMRTYLLIQKRENGRERYILYLV